ncbi:MAG: hypothetical protein ACR2P0_11555, partial [Acidimicrobiales bacterium]
MTTIRQSRLFSLLVALFALSLVAAACGSDEATGTATSECGTDNAVEAPDDAVTDLTVAVVAPSAKDDLAFTQSMIDSLTRLASRTSARIVMMA